MTGFSYFRDIIFGSRLCWNERSSLETATGHMIKSLGAIRSIRNMRALTIILTLITFKSFGQIPIDRPATDWNDTTYIPIILNFNSTNQGIIEYDYGQHALIYMNFSEVRALCSERVMKWQGQNYQVLLNRMDSLFKSADTIRICDNNSELELLTAEILLRGNGKVYDKKNQQYVNEITHRVEKYGSQAFRFYYLPDKRAFFAIMELIGIRDEHEIPFQSKEAQNDEYLKLGERLQQIWHGEKK